MININIEKYIFKVFKVFVVLVNISGICWRYRSMEKLSWRLICMIMFIRKEKNLMKNLDNYLMKEKFIIFFENKLIIILKD